MSLSAKQHRCSTVLGSFGPEKLACLISNSRRTMKFLHLIPSQPRMSLKRSGSRGPRKRPSFERCLVRHSPFAMKFQHRNGHFRGYFAIGHGLTTSRRPLHPRRTIIGIHGRTYLPAAHIALSANPIGRFNIHCSRCHDLESTNVAFEKNTTAFFRSVSFALL
jgi:hypothetical protein